jgi:hypothetical protein
VVKKISIFILAAFLLAIASPGEVLAAKKRVSRGKAGTTVGKTTTRGVQSSVRFKPNRLGVILTLSGFANITSVSYQLTYTANGVPQGVMGTVQPSSTTETRELLFATCSGNVCRYHSNIRNARLVVTSKLKSGVTVRKPYRIKV